MSNNNESKKRTKTQRIKNQTDNDVENKTRRSKKRKQQVQDEAKRVSSKVLNCKDENTTTEKKKH